MSSLNRQVYTTPMRPHGNCQAQKAILTQLLRLQLALRELAANETNQDNKPPLRTPEVVLEPFLRPLKKSPSSAMAVPSWPMFRTLFRCPPPLSALPKPLQPHPQLLQATLPPASSPPTPTPLLRAPIVPYSGWRTTLLRTSPCSRGFPTFNHRQVTLCLRSLPVGLEPVELLCLILFVPPLELRMLTGTISVQTFRFHSAADNSALVITCTLRTVFVPRNPPPHHLPFLRTAVAQMTAAGVIEPT